MAKRPSKKPLGPPTTIQVLAWDLRMGDRFSDETGEWEVAWRPRIGRVVEAHLRSVGQPDTASDRVWDVHEQITVKRRRGLPRDCPKCGLVNPSEAQRCDCGYDFLARRMRRSYLVRGQFPKGAGLGVAGALFIYLLIRVLVGFFSK
jgi:hypothetical protein